MPVDLKLLPYPIQLEIQSNGGYCEWRDAIMLENLKYSAGGEARIIMQRQRSRLKSAGAYLKLKTKYIYD